MKKFVASEFSDERMIYAVKYLTKMGYEKVSNIKNADFELIPPKTDKTEKSVDYLNDESFLTKNAFLTAEGAVALAIIESSISLAESKILIIGYGRIAKALHKYLSAFTSNITISARKETQRATAQMNGARTIDIDELDKNSDFDFIFNTVPFPVLNEKELKVMKQTALIVDLASFPGGVDKHFAQKQGIKLVHALGVPAKYSPKTAGKFVAEAVSKIVEEGDI